MTASGSNTGTALRSRRAQALVVTAFACVACTAPAPPPRAAFASAPAPGAPQPGTTPGSEQPEQAEPVACVSAEQAAEAAIAQLRADVLGLWGRLIQQTPKESRTALFTEMLADDAPAVRELALTRLQRAILNAEPIDASIDAAVSPLLRDPSPTIRRLTAAALHARAAPNGPALAINPLRTESDPSAAAAMLILVARAPASEAVSPALRWLNDAQARSAASSVLLNAHRQGVLDTPGLRFACLESLRSLSDDAFTPGALTLLAEIGDASDVDRIGDLLLRAEPARRQEIASAVVPVSAAAPMLVRAARVHADLLRLTARALASHAPYNRSLRTLESLPAESEEARVFARETVLDALAPAELLLVAADAADPTTQRALLLRAERPAYTESHAGDPALAEVLLRLVSYHLSAKDAPAALGTMELVPPSAKSDAETTHALRIGALLRLGKVDEALSLECPLWGWLDALEACVADNAPHTAEAFTRVTDSAFFRASALRPADAIRLNTLREQCSPPAAAAPDADRQPGPAPSPSTPAE